MRNRSKVKKIAGSRFCCFRVIKSGKMCRSTVVSPLWLLLIARVSGSSSLSTWRQDQPLQWTVTEMGNAPLGRWAC